MDAKKTGELIARRRKEQGLSQGELAERIHVTDKAVSKWETGRGMPGIDSLEPLAEVLGLSVSELLSGQRLTEEEKPKAAERQMMESMERERRTRRMSNLLTALTALIGIAAIGWGTWLAAHYLGSVPETDIAGLEQGAVAYLGTPREMLLGPFDYNALQIVEMERRGDYLAALCTDGQGNWCMCVYDRDSVFSDRWRVGGGKSSLGAGEFGQLELRQSPGGGHHPLRRGTAGGGGLLYLPEQRHHLHLSHPGRAGAGRVPPAGHCRHCVPPSEAAG